MSPLVLYLIAGGTVVVDDLDAGCVQVGGWISSTEDKGYWAKGYAWHTKGHGGAYTRWRTPPEPGRWAVFARWVCGKGDRATDAPFWIAHADGVSRVRVDMSDETLGSRWNLLGVFEFNGTGFVMLTDDADNSVVADAVRFAPEDQATGAEEVGGREELLDAHLDPLDNWKAEGNLESFRVSSREGRIRVKTTENDRSEGGFLWLRRQVPADFSFEFDFTPLSKTGSFSVFFCARGSDGRDLLGPEHEETEEKRLARWFSKYTDGRVDCYHLSYRRGKNNNCRLRRSPGLKVLKTEAGEHLREGVTHRIRLLKRGGGIRYVVDGESRLEYVDPSPMGAGRLGLRQAYEGEGEYSNMRLLAPAG